MKLPHRRQFLHFAASAAAVPAICACARAATAAENELSVVDPAKAGWNTAALDELAAYVQSQGTTGFLIIQDRKVIYEHNWPLPSTAAAFAANFTHGTDVHGALQDDVMSAQKSFVAILAGIAIDKRQARYFEACL
jgi:hypothetical protein